MLFAMANSGYFTWQPLVMIFYYGYLAIAATDGPVTATLA